MKIRRTYKRKFKLQIVRECENSKAMAQLSRQHGIHPSLITRWKKEYRDDPENAFSGKGNIYKEDARLGDLEKMKLIPKRAQRHTEKNNNSLRSSASSAVNFFCHDPLIQNKIKSLRFRGILSYEIHTA